jgi:TolB protein
VTRHWAIETEATWAPNGQSIFFSSDRRGQPQIFQVFLDTGELSRVTFEGTYNANPVVSQDGRFLAMVTASPGQGYHIGLLDLFTRDFRVLTSTFLDESPSFAPNGQMIIYAMNRNGRGELAVVSVEGGASQTLKVQNGEVKEPDWGPYLEE